MMHGFRSVVSYSTLPPRLLVAAFVVALACGCGCESDDGGSDAGSHEAGASGAAASAGTDGTSPTTGGSSSGVSTGGRGGSEQGGGGSTATGGSTASGGESGSGPSEAGAAGTGGEAGSGQAGNGGGDSDVPLLERTPRLEQDCAEVVPLTKLGLDPWLTGSLASTPEGLFLLRGQGAADFVDQLVVSSIDSSGSLGPDVTLAPEGTNLSNGFGLVSREGGLAALWCSYGSDDTMTLVFAELDDTGELAGAPTSILQSSTRSGCPKIAAGANGYALLYTETAADDSSSWVKVAMLDDAGALVGDAVTLFEGEPWISVGEVIAIPGGYAATYASTDYTTSNGSRRTIAFLDADGQPSGEPIEIEVPTGAASPFDDLLLQGNELIAAYTEQSGESDAVSVTVRVARIDLETHAVTADVALQSPVTDQENIAPELMAIGEDIGLVWSQGSVIYVCAGCMPDNHLEFVLLDGEDLTPLAEPVVLENQATMGGFISPSMALAGTDILLTSTLAYHVSGEGAFASVRCQVRP